MFFCKFHVRVYYVIGMELWKIVFLSILEILHFILVSLPRFPFHSILNSLPCPVDLFIFYLFLILIWLCSVFEADFHTDPETKKFFLIG